MSNQDPLTAEERRLESQLQRLTPRAPHLCRDTLMFEAGRRAERGRLRSWQGAAVALLAGVMWFGLPAKERPSRGGSQPLAQVREPGVPASLPETPLSVSQPTPPDAHGASQYLRWRRRLVIEGVDALPAPPAYSTLPDPPESVAGWYRSLGANPEATVPVRKPQGQRDRS